MLRTQLRAWPNNSGYNATSSHSAPSYLTPGWASSCHGAPDVAVISNTGGNLKRHPCQTQSHKQGTFNWFSFSYMSHSSCKHPEKTSFFQPPRTLPPLPPRQRWQVSPNTEEGFKGWQPENKTREMSPQWIHRTQRTHEKSATNH